MRGRELDLPSPWDDPFVREWLTLPPRIADRDLRGVLYVSREHAPLISPQDRLSSEAAELLDALLKHPDMAASLKDRLSKMPRAEITVVMDRLLDRARQEQEWGVPPILEACLAAAEPTRRRVRALRRSSQSALCADQAGYRAKDRRSALGEECFRRLGEVRWRVYACQDSDKATEGRWERPRPVRDHGGVPMVPPWVPTLRRPPARYRMATDAASADGEGQDINKLLIKPAVSAAASASVVASGASRSSRAFWWRTANLGKFARSGDSRDMGRGLRDYVRKGYGGGGTAVRRFGGTASTAGALHGALSGAAAGCDHGASRSP